MTHDFLSVARLPAPDDNVAIATQRLEVETQIQYDDEQFSLSHSVLEGHRFAIQSIAAGEPLLSWGLPFGYASGSIVPGDYVCNQKMIDSLSIRNLNFDLPNTPNFIDMIKPFVLDENAFNPGKQVERHPEDRNFLGYKRSSHRGVGTRNYIVVMGTTSRTSGFARKLADQCSSIAERYADIDGIVSVTHTDIRN